MLFGLSEEEFQAFILRIAATEIANHAFMKCVLSGYPATADNVILLVGDFAEPSDPVFETLATAVYSAIIALLGEPEAPPTFRN